MKPEDFMEQTKADPFRDLFVEVEIKPTIRHEHTIDPSRVIRRFVDLPKFFSMITKRQLVLPTIGSLAAEDPFECTAPRLNLEMDEAKLRRRAIQLREYAPTHYPPRPKPKFPIVTAKAAAEEPDKYEKDLMAMDGIGLEQAVQYLERRRLKDYLVCSCWHSTDGGESSAMWKLYAGEMGVMISSTVQKIECAIRSVRVLKWYSDRFEFVFAPVEYTNSEDMSATPMPWLRKRESFEHEKEIRLYSELPFEPAGSLFALNVDLAVMLEEIVITPFAQKWQSEAIQLAIEGLLKNYGLSIPIRVSDHMCVPDPHWPNAFSQLFRGISSGGLSESARTACNLAALL